MRMQITLGLNSIVIVTILLSALIGCNEEYTFPKYFMAIDAGGYHSMALATDGTLWTWGNNDEGQLGNGTIDEESRPVRIGLGFTMISAGAKFSLALKKDGTIWGWGENTSGQLGIGTNVSASSPIEIDSGYIAIAAGANHAVALKEDGTLWSWGNNEYGQLGNGTNVSSSVPVKIGSDFTSIAAGGAVPVMWVYNVSGHSMALKRDGTLWAWGSNSYGQLGDGTSEDRNLPVEVGSGFTKIAVGSTSSRGLKEDGTLWGWGSIYGQSPVINPALIGSDYASMSTDDHDLALKTDGTLWAWGHNQLGQLGDSTNVDKMMPVRTGSDYLAVSAGDGYSLAIKTDGSLWAWGWNYYHQVGDGTREDKNFPVQIQ